MLPDVVVYPVCKPSSDQFVLPPLEHRSLPQNVIDFHNTTWATTPHITTVPKLPKSFNSAIWKKGYNPDKMIDKMEDVCLVKIGRCDHKFEWLVGSVYMNCEGERKEDNILKLEYIKGVVWRALDDGLGIMIGGDMNAHIGELNGCENKIVGGQRKA